MIAQTVVPRPATTVRTRSDDNPPAKHPTAPNTAPMKAANVSAAAGHSLATSSVRVVGAPSSSVWNGGSRHPRCMRVSLARVALSAVKGAGCSADDDVNSTRMDTVWLSRFASYIGCALFAPLRTRGMAALSQSGSRANHGHSDTLSVQYR
jgi:hypothetical protein